MADTSVARVRSFGFGLKASVVAGQITSKGAGAHALSLAVAPKSSVYPSSVFNPTSGSCYPSSSRDWWRLNDSSHWIAVSGNRRSHVLQACRAARATVMACRETIADAQKLRSRAAVHLIFSVRARIATRRTVLRSSRQHRRCNPASHFEPGLALANGTSD